MRIVVISDLQVPYHDRRAVDAVARFIKAYKPDRVDCVGDEIDAPQISRWHKGMAGEFAGTLGRHRDETCRVLEQLKVTNLSRSNHSSQRLENYLAKYAPGLAELPELTIERFLRTEDLGITYHHTPFAIAPGWVMGHGDEGSLIQSPGGTALNIAKRFGKSFVGGHTHKMGVKHDHDVLNGKTLRSLWGFEVGCLMDMKKATYLKAGSANWQLGFGILHVDGKNVTPVPVPIHRDGSFTVDGRVFR